MTMRRGMMLLGSAVVLMTACSLDSILKSDELPTDVTNPAITQTAEGAVAAYVGTLAQFRVAFGGASGSTPDVGASVVAATGLFSDELQWFDTSFPMPADIRDAPEGTNNSAYSRLQKVRGQAGQAIGLLTRYAPGREALVGHTYAIQGYAEMFLAEIFCSGIPLSTLDFDGDFTYKPGSTTEQVYEHALVLFDTALTLATDSARFVHFARLGQARVLLALGRFADAAAAVTDVPDDYAYRISYSGTGNDVANFARIINNRWALSVGDREGINGLNYRTSGDPRTRVTQRGSTTGFVRPIYHPDKYTSTGTSTGLTTGSSSIVVASGVEARLIEAEADLRSGGGNWLTILNALRTNGTFTTRPNASDTTKRDTLWNAGTGAVAGLRPLADPTTAEARVDLLFRERAFWLFLTGHRHTDLRRLIRHYGRNEADVYPTGTYVSATAGLAYGSDVDLPIPPAEAVANPHFTGCAARGT